MIPKYELAIDLITHFEGFSSTPYLCPAGVKTIGYGRTYGSMALTTKEAEREWLQTKIKSIDDHLYILVKRKLNPYQRAALISFIYNVGEGAFQRSTLRAMLNDGRHSTNTTSDQFLRWCKAGDDVLPGLVKRRYAEWKLFRDGEKVWGGI